MFGWVGSSQVRSSMVRYGYTVQAGRDVRAVPPCLAERLAVWFGEVRHGGFLRGWVRQGAAGCGKVWTCGARC